MRCSRYNHREGTKGCLDSPGRQVPMTPARRLIACVGRVATCFEHGLFGRSCLNRTGLGGIRRSPLETLERFDCYNVFGSFELNPKTRDIKAGVLAP
ncbi:hypothetical protein Taro_046279 [Colocasia esculenta]|uniref:Uncharacterized protein n=1 Tax=Colocasia esculenta TaxID=4460 RepID=A0A843WYK5_COLES|nr:hypothetical protein [Colocasia esculenta]